jgi:beta-fructofuranosidase
VNTQLKDARAKETEIYAKIAASRELYTQRPVFHFASPAGWINDPNGFSFFKGICHLFFQYYPYGMHWGPMHWGHAVTTDFISWQNEPAALAPDTEADAKGCFSGTAIEADGKHIIAYTGVSEKDGINVQNQCIASGDGKTYTKFPCNPVITADNVPFKYDVRDFRDPKLWYEKGNYYLAAVLRTADKSGALALFSSKNLEQWTFVSMIDASRGKLGQMWECPDIFKLDGHDIILLSLQGIDADRRGYFHNGNNSAYMSGIINPDTYTFCRDKRPENGLEAALLDYGIDFYAPETTLAPDGRRIMISWMHNWEAYSTPDGYLWSGMMSIPRELVLKDGWLYQNPVREITNYYKDTVSGRQCILSGSSTYQGISGRHLDLTIRIKETDTRCARNITIKFAADETHCVMLAYDLTAHTLTFDRTFCGYCRDVLSVRTMIIQPEADGTLELRCLLDTCSLEVFINGGKYAFTNTFYAPQNADGIVFETDGKIIFDYTCSRIEKAG